MKCVQPFQGAKYVPHDEVFCNTTDEKDPDYCISSGHNLSVIGMLSYRRTVDQHDAGRNRYRNLDFYSHAYTHTYTHPGSTGRMVQLLDGQ